MSLSPRLGLLVEPFDVCLQLLPVDPPHAASADLYSGELSGSNERVHLGNAHAEVRGHVLEREEAGLDLGTRLLCRRLPWHGTKDNQG